MALAASHRHVDIRPQEQCKMGDFHREEGETRKLLAKTSKDCSRQGHRPQGEGQGFSLGGAPHLPLGAGSHGTDHLTDADPEIPD